MNLYKKDNNAVDYVKISNIHVLKVILLILIPLVTLVFALNPVISNSIEKIPIAILDSKSQFTEEKLKLKIQELNLKYPDIVYAQALLESGNFQSGIFINNHNLFGMKVASTRPTTALRTELSHAFYSNWESSVLDYALWQTTFARGLSKEQYLNLLNDIYAEDNSYKEKLIKLMPIYLKK